MGKAHPGGRHDRARPTQPRRGGNITSRRGSCLPPRGHSTSARGRFSLRMAVPAEKRDLPRKETFRERSAVATSSLLPSANARDSAFLLASLTVEQLSQDVEMAQMTSGLFDHMNEDPAQGDLAADVPGSIIELEERSALTGFL